MLHKLPHFGGKKKQRTCLKWCFLAYGSVRACTQVAWVSGRGLCSTPWYLIWQDHPKGKHLHPHHMEVPQHVGFGQDLPLSLPCSVSMDYIPFLPVYPGDTSHPTKWHASPLYPKNQLITYCLAQSSPFLVSQSCVLTERRVYHLQNTVHWVRALCLSVSPLDCLPTRTVQY